MYMLLIIPILITFSYAVYSASICYAHGVNYYAHAGRRYVPIDSLW